MCYVHPAYPLAILYIEEEGWQIVFEDILISENEDTCTRTVARMQYKKCLIYGIEKSENFWLFSSNISKDMHTNYKK